MGSRYDDAITSKYTQHEKTSPKLEPTEKTKKLEKLRDEHGFKKSTIEKIQSFFPERDHEAIIDHLKRNIQYIKGIQETISTPLTVAEALEIHKQQNFEAPTVVHKKIKPFLPQSEDTSSRFTNEIKTPDNHHNMQDYNRLPLNQWKSIKSILYKNTGMASNELQRKIRGEIAAMVAVILKSKGENIRITENVKSYNPPWNNPGEACKRILPLIDKVTYNAGSEMASILNTIENAYKKELAELRK